MITTDHLEDVSYQLHKLGCLYAALSMAVDGIDMHENVTQTRDAIIGVTEVLGVQLEKCHETLGTLFKIAPFADKPEAA